MLLRVQGKTQAAIIHAVLIVHAAVARYKELSEGSHYGEWDCCRLSCSLDAFGLPC